MNTTATALFMKFGHVEFKVQLVLNEYVWKMLAVCDLIKEVDSKKAAELMMARFYSHRNIILFI